ATASGSPTGCGATCSRPPTRRVTGRVWPRRRRSSLEAHAPDRRGCVGMTEQRVRLREIADEDLAAGRDPLYVYPDYRSTVRRGPKKPLLVLPRTFSETTGPVFGQDAVDELDSDLTCHHDGEPLGERIIVTGRVLDDTG